MSLGGGPGRPSFIDDPEQAQQVAVAFADGASRKDMAGVFHVSEPTITKWRKDPRVKAHVIRLIEERTVRVCRKVDSEIEGRLASAGDMTVKELLAIRQEFAGGMFGGKKDEMDRSEAVAGALEAFDENPELARKLAELLNSAV